MRKADYAALAAILRETLAHYDASPSNDNVRCTSACEAVEHVARRFADVASVDRASFLKACGID